MNPTQLEDLWEAIHVALPAYEEYVQHMEEAGVVTRQEVALLEALKKAKGLIVEVMG
jgi:hypothetical protein